MTVPQTPSSSTMSAKVKTAASQFAEADEKYKDKLESMTMEERALLGLPYIAADPALVDTRTTTRKLLRQYNQSEPGPTSANETEGFNDISNQARRAILEKLFKIDSAKAKRIFIEPPFWCDYGSNIVFEGDFYCNFNTTILDVAKVTLGHGVLFGPNVHIYSATHGTSVLERETGHERALPVSVGSNTWVGGNTTIMAGVNIGEGCTIGAGSVVTRDIPDWSIAVGNPARVLKTVPEEERGKRDGKSGAVPF